MITRGVFDTNRFPGYLSDNTYTPSSSVNSGPVHATFSGVLNVFGRDADYSMEHCTYSMGDAEELEEASSKTRPIASLGMGTDTRRTSDGCGKVG